MNRSHLKIILFFIPLISYATSFGMENNDQKIPAIKKIYTQTSNLIKYKINVNKKKSNLINNKTPVKTIILAPQNPLITRNEVLITPFNEEISNLISNNKIEVQRINLASMHNFLTIPNELLENHITPYLLISEPVKGTCKYFYIRCTQSLAFMPDDIAALYNQYAATNKPCAKELIFCYYLLQENTKNINWMVKHLKISKEKSFNITLNNYLNARTTVNLSPALILTQNNTIKSLSKATNDSLKAIEKIFTTKSLRFENDYTFIPCIINTCLNKAPNLEKLISSQQMTLTKEGINYLLYLCINYGSIECFNYLKTREESEVLWTNQRFRFWYLFDAIRTNSSFADYLITLKSYDINAIEDRIPKFQLIYGTFLDAVLEAKNYADIHGPYNFVINYLEKNNAIATPEEHKNDLLLLKTFS